MTKKLLNHYRVVLDAHNLSTLTSEAEAYSGVFLPDPLPVYHQAKFRLMVVGQETKGWNGKLNRLLAAKTAGNLTDYMDHAAGLYQRHRQRRPGRSRFLQFLSEVEQQLGLPHHSIHWANLFACDYRKATPRLRPEEEVSALVSLSRDLLAGQIEHLRPDAVLFTTGPRCDVWIKTLCKERLGGYSESVVIEPRKLWAFKAGGIPCYRTTHPRYLSDNGYRRQALALIGQHCQSGATTPAALIAARPNAPLGPVY